MTVSNESLAAVMAVRHFAYTYMVPSILLLTLLALFVNVFVLIAYCRIGMAKLNPGLRLTLGLGECRLFANVFVLKQQSATTVVADIWTSFLMAMQMFMNAYLPFHHGIELDSELPCFILTAEVLSLSTNLSNTRNSCRFSNPPDKSHPYCTWWRWPPTTTSVSRIRSSISSGSPLVASP